MPDLTPWLPFIGAVLAAVVAGLFAYRANQSSLANQRIVELEKRLATFRLDTYKPLLVAMNEYFNKDNPTPQEERRREQKLQDALREAALWVPIYGSDETVRALQRMMQVAFSSPPAPIMLRTYGEFMIAMRRDLGDSETKVDLVDLLGIRLKDIYTGDEGRNLKLSADEYYAKHGWTPPWRAPE